MTHGRLFKVVWFTRVISCAREPTTHGGKEQTPDDKSVGSVSVLNGGN